MNKLFFLFFIVLAVSCSSETAPHPDENYSYINKDINRRITVPEGWSIYADDPAAAAAAAAENLDSLLNSASPLFGFGKDEYNSFQSSVEPFQENYQGEWMINFNGMKKLMSEMYSSEQIRLDTSESVPVEILNRKFFTYDFILYDKSGEIKLCQTFYSTLVNNHDFTICMSYNSQKSREELMTILENSHLD